MIRKDNRKLNSTLNFLNQNREQFGFQSKYFHEQIGVADDPLEQHLILEKLSEDNLVYRNFAFSTETKEIAQRTDPFYIIKFDGILFIKKGGYPENLTQYLIQFLKKNIVIIIAILALIISFLSYLRPHIDFMNLEIRIDSLEQHTHK